MLISRSTRLVALVLALAAIACDGAQTKAYQANIRRSHELFALTNAPVNTHSGIAFIGAGSVAVDANFLFDVAVDLDPAGGARIYPVRAVAGGLAGNPKRVGMQIVTGSFEALTEAPTTGYDTLGYKVLTPGSVMALQMLESSQYCLYSLTPLVYAKLVIDSIRTSDRRIFARSVVDPNCGFRGLIPDSIPSR